MRFTFSLEMTELTSLEQAGSPFPSPRLHAQEFLKAAQGDEGHGTHLYHLDMPFLNQHVELRPTDAGDPASLFHPHRDHLRIAIQAPLRNDFISHTSTLEPHLLIANCLSAATSGIWGHSRGHTQAPVNAGPRGGGSCGGKHRGTRGGGSRAPRRVGGAFTPR